MTKRTGIVSLAGWDIHSINEVADKAKDELSHMLQTQMDASLQISAEVDKDSIPRIHVSLPFGGKEGSENWVVWKVNLNDVLQELTSEDKGVEPYTESEIDALINVFTEALNNLSKAKTRFRTEKNEN